MTNPGATGKFYWTRPNPKGPAAEPVELVNPDGTLAGVTLRTLENAWGAYLDADRKKTERRIIEALNGSAK